MSTLSDILQAASNTAADTVSAPVDILAWLSRKAGIPVGNAPVGGSDWMRAQGLTRPVQQSAASLTGETLGLLSPIAAAAKAPQIARGLLAAGDNLAAPVARGPMATQRGAIVYHGSPHKFDKFDASKIGTGEGAQAYGHGLYLAEAPDVAKSYSQAGDAAAPVVKNWIAEADDAGVQASQSYQWARDAIAKRLANTNSPRVRQTLSDALARFDEILGGGNLYKVDLPDEAIARMLDWDKPLSQQAPGVQRALARAQQTFQQNGIDPAASRALQSMEDIGYVTDKYGRGMAGVSGYLRAQGIPGIRYLDGGSRGAGTGTSNYVVFPGEEELLKIIERNGKGLLSP